jgi:hypothetical protein
VRSIVMFAGLVACASPRVVAPAHHEVSHVTNVEGATAPAVVAMETNGVIRGIVFEQARPVSNVTVIVTSPALNSTRSAITNAHGFYRIDQLPVPADYLVTFYFGDRVSQQRTSVTAEGPTAISTTVFTPERVDPCVALSGPKGSVCFELGDRTFVLRPDGRQIELSQPQLELVR